jgi:hypothetical protein
MIIAELCHDRESTLKSKLAKFEANAFINTMSLLVNKLFENDSVSLARSSKPQSRPPSKSSFSQNKTNTSRPCVICGGTGHTFDGCKVLLDSAGVKTAYIKLRVALNQLHGLSGKSGQSNISALRSHTISFFNRIPVMAPILAPTLGSFFLKGRFSLKNRTYCPLFSHDSTSFKNMWLLT